MAQEIFDVLHLLEHKLLPDLFFEGKAGFIDYATDREPNGIFEAFQRILDSRNLENPYTPEDFERHMIELTDGRTADEYKEFALIVSFPEPEIASLCFKSFFLFDATCTNQAYFTLEKMEKRGNPYIYDWNPDGTHPFCGTVSFDENDQLRRLVGLYLEKRK